MPNSSVYILRHDIEEVNIDGPENNFSSTVI